MEIIGEKSPIHVKVLDQDHNSNLLLNHVSTLTSAIHEKQIITDNKEDETGCIVCFTQYDDEVHRPRSLQCGHTLCTNCVEKAILKQFRKCPKCMTSFSASNAKEIPVNYSLESVIKLLNSHKNLKRKLLPEETDYQITKKPRVTESTKPETVPECVEHQLPVSQRCSTHKSWICQNCLQYDHSSELCKIITISEALKFKKLKQLAQSKSFVDTFKKGIREAGMHINIYKEQIKEYDEEITGFDTMVEKLLEVIECKKQTRMKMEKICNDFDQKLNTLRTKRIYYDQSVISLNGSETIRKVSQCSMEVQNESEKLQLITNEINQEVDKMHKMMQNPRNANSESNIGLSLGNHELSVRDGKYHLHAIKGKTSSESDYYCLEISGKNSSRIDGILTFLDIACPDQQPQRIYIKMLGDTIRSQQHLLLCVGQCGYSYRGLCFDTLLYKDQPGERLEICCYDGTNCRPLFNDVTVNDYITRDVKAGIVTGSGMPNDDDDDDDEDDFNTALFAVHLRDDPEYGSNSVFGVVTSGLEALRKIAKSNDIEKFKIVDCGVVLI